MKKIIILFGLLTGCATQSTVFGGKITSDYYKYFDNQLECAVVEGWYPEAKCMCHIVDPNFSVNKSFLWAYDKYCTEEGVKEKEAELVGPSDYSL
jgi:hypothetical protein